MVQEARVRVIREAAAPKDSRTVVYWMSREQRAADNWALLYALETGKRARLPTVVLFSLEESCSGSGIGQDRFMLEGLRLTAGQLEARGIVFILLEGDMHLAYRQLAVRLRPALMVTDLNPLTSGIRLLDSLQSLYPGPIHQVDAHNIVPVWKASPKREYAARTIRPKIHRLLPEFLIPFPAVPHQSYPFSGGVPRIDWEAIFLRHPANPAYPPAGTAAGKKRLAAFLRNKLEGYEEGRNDPNREATSGLSPYFHFGQVAPQRAALDVIASPPGPGVDAFLEELVIRRELSDNFCWYTPEYDRLTVMPDWAQRTLEAHRPDPREYLYSRDELAAGGTHDVLWNAAQTVLATQGRMHGYLRMYWAKKVLEWSVDPATALETVIYLNDLFALDGRDPNGYVGAAWSIAGLHDRPWGTRPVFGSVRYMNFAGCRRKFDVDAYVRAVSGLSG